MLSFLTRVLANQLNLLEEMTIFVLKEWARVSGGLALSPLMLMNAVAALFALIQERLGQHGLDISRLRE